ncbi:MAG TPA: protein kinase, partial [Pyrinomonadaceae bacterium]|nr:protein kinase [Pyrinomonadaceae bacterium]
TQFGRYEIRSKIGEGGMGEVYSALDRELDRSVAIKLLPSEFTLDADRRSRFRQEAKAVSALNHPNIITIYEIGENEHGSYLATEFVEGRTLREVLKNESLTLPRILRIVEQAANALVAAHQAGIVHRDIKPENIMVRSDSIVKVLDFGLAKPINPDNGDTAENKTLPGTVMGSARYMSPEQARGRDIDERTDIWSLGVVLYEMLIGSVPFEGDTTADTIAAVVYKEPEPISDLLPNLPPELGRIVRKALQKDRDERYQDIKDMSLDLKELLNDVERANSGSTRTSGSISSPDFLENPTVIHRTVSANHRTEAHSTRYSGQVTGAERAFGSPLRKAVAAVLGVMLFVAVGVGIYAWYGGENGLARTAFDRPQITRVETDGSVMLPAISPDGRYVAYVSGEFGSRSVVVQQISTGSTITLVPPTNLSLQSVVFSPTGDHVYYTQMTGDMSVATLYQVPTLGGQPKKLIEDIDSPITFSPGGDKFAFIRHVPQSNSDLILIADAETLEVQPLISSEETDYDFFTFRAAWSPKSDAILIGAGRRQSGFVTGTDVVSISVADKTVRRAVDQDFFTVNNFAWFSDGSGFVFTGRAAQNDPVQIWKMGLDGGGLHPLTNDTNDYVDLGISADGRNLVTIKGDTSGGLWRVDRGSGAASQLTPDSRTIEGKYGITQRPDGSLVFTRFQNKEADIWIADAELKEQKVLIDDTGFAVDPKFTPDGKFLVFNLQKDKRSRIWRANADGTNPVPLTPESSENVDYSPQMVAGGSAVIFQRQTADKERFKLMKVSIDGGEPEVFYERDDLGIFNPRLSPDGKRIAFTSYDLKHFNKRLHTATVVDGSFGEIVTTVDLNLINDFAWSPDSRELTIVSNRSGTQNLWRFPVDGGEPRPITEFKSGRILNFAWSRDGSSLFVARGTTRNELIILRDGVAELSRKSKVPGRGASL